jgi:hypothetical protein
LTKGYECCIFVSSTTQLFTIKIQSNQNSKQKVHRLQPQCLKDRAPVLTKRWFGPGLDWRRNRANGSSNRSGMTATLLQSKRHTMANLNPAGFYNSRKRQDQSLLLIGVHHETETYMRQHSQGLFLDLKQNNTKNANQDSEYLRSRLKFRPDSTRGRDEFFQAFGKPREQTFGAEFFADFYGNGLTEALTRFLNDSRICAG